MTYIPEGWDDSLQAMPAPAPALPPIGAAAQQALLNEGVPMFRIFYGDPKCLNVHLDMDFEIFAILCEFNSMMRFINLTELSEDQFLHVLAMCSQDWLV